MMMFLKTFSPTLRNIDHSLQVMFYPRHHKIPAKFISLNQKKKTLKWNQEKEPFRNNFYFSIMQGDVTKFLIILPSSKLFSLLSSPVGPLPVNPRLITAHWSLGA